MHELIKDSKIKNNSLFIKEVTKSLLLYIGVTISVLIGYKYSNLQSIGFML